VFVIIAYDIVKDKTRYRVAKLLEGYGDRVQDSVFESVMTKEKIDELMDRIGRLVDPEQDSVRLYRMDKDYRDRVTMIGDQKIFEDLEVYIV